MKQFRSTGSYEPDPKSVGRLCEECLFRSTGSYEPDHAAEINPVLQYGRFDPQALTSLTGTRPSAART